MNFTVITNCLNSVGTLHDTLVSANKQSLAHVSHLILDGVSSEVTISIINNFPIKGSFISNQDAGLHDSLNQGVSLAGDGIIGFLHADNVLAHDHVLESIHRAFEMSGADSVYGDLQYVQEDLKKVHRTW